MKRALILAALLAAGPGVAQDMVFRSGKDYVRLHDAPCAGQVLQHIPPALASQFRAAVAEVDGKAVVGCWALQADGRVFLQYADGDFGLIRMSSFKPAPGA